MWQKDGVILKRRGQISNADKGRGWDEGEGTGVGGAVPPGSGIYI